MRIILQETEPSGHPCRRADISITTDDLSLPELWDALIKPALLAMSFTDRAVAEFPAQIEGEESNQWIVRAEPIQEEPDPVIDPAMEYRTRDGRKVTGMRVTLGLPYPVEAYVDDILHLWPINGRHNTTVSDDSPLDLIPTGNPAQ